MNEKQTVRFFESARGKDTSTITVDGAEGQALVIFDSEKSLEAFENDNPPSIEELIRKAGNACKNRADSKLWDSIKFLDEFFAKYNYAPSVKIYPKSAIPDDVPADFFEKKQVRYEDLKDQKAKVPPFIAGCLRTAAHIRDFDKDENENEMPSTPTGMRTT